MLWLLSYTNSLNLAKQEWQSLMKNKSEHCSCHGCLSYSAASLSVLRFIPPHFYLNSFFHFITIIIFLNPVVETGFHVKFINETGKISALKKNHGIV